MISRPFIILFLLLFKVAAFCQSQNRQSYDSPDYTAFQAWVAKTMIYPDAAKKKGIQGIVHIQFKIDGSYHVVPESIKVVSGLTKACDDEALRVMKMYTGTFTPPDKKSFNPTLPWIVPFKFVIKDDHSNYAVSGPDHKIEKFSRQQWFRKI